MTPWILALDESGAVDDGRQPALLGGVLINARNTTTLRAALRAAIAAALPGVPWPPHATDLNFPAMRAVYAARGVAGASPSARNAAVWLGLGPATTVDQEAARALGRRLNDASPSLHGRLFAECRAGRDAMASLVRALPAASLGHGAFVVAAWEDGSAQSGGPARYRRLFDALVQRVELLIAGTHDRHRIEVHAASYADVGVAALGSITRRPAPSRRDNVAWFPFPPEPYFRDDVHPLVVVADHVCNRVRHGLAGSWSNVQHRLDGDLGLAPTCALWGPGRALPTVAALGFPAEQIDRAYAGGAKLELLPPLYEHDPRWAGEQAALWVDAVGDQ